MAGRPPAPIDWKTVDRLLQAGCLGTQIAARLAIRPEVLYDACQREHKANFTEYSAQKREHGETLLLEKQMEAAMKGDKTMLIWLGKQRLGQADKSEANNNSTVKILNTDVITRSSGVPLALDEKHDDDE